MPEAPRLGKYTQCLWPDSAWVGDTDLKRISRHETIVKLI